MIKTFLFLLIPILASMALGGFIVSIMQFEKGDFPLWLFLFLFSTLLLILSCIKYKSTEDDFLFLWVKVKSKRLRDKQELSKEVMRKELEEDLK